GGQAPAQVDAVEPAALEVHAFHQRIRGDDEVLARRGTQHGGIVAHADDHAARERSGAADGPRQSGEEVEFGFHGGAGEPEASLQDEAEGGKPPRWAGRRIRTISWRWW